MEALHEMDCKSCANGETILAGAHQTCNGTLIITKGNSIKCTNDSVRTINIFGNKMYCSDFKERRKTGGDESGCRKTG